MWKVALVTLFQGAILTFAWRD